MRSLTCLAAAGLLLVPALAGAVNPAVWSINETLTRSESELFWTSPTAVDLGLDRYTFDYEITRIAVTALLIEVDVTDQIGQSFALTGAGEVDSPPFVLFNDALNDPDTGTMADVRIEIDADGFGRAAFTNVMLGTVQTGLFPVAISAVNVQATVTVTGEEFAPGDYNGDGLVDQADYLVWTSAVGSVGPNPADGNDDGVVNTADYAVWRDALPALAAAVSIPEPSTLGLAIVAMAFAARNLTPRA